jgi:hypothetical protein
MVHEYNARFASNYDYSVAAALHEG